MREEWKYISFEEGLEKVAKTSKIASSDYKEKGKYPIVSQEETLISGFWDNYDDVYKIQHPVVIFGDHTRIIKFIDFNFVVGADGVKILSPKSNIAPKFFYYYLRWCNIPSLGYSRHYKLLKELQIPVPPLPEQERIVAELDLLTGIIDKQKAQLKELDTLAQSIFYDMFGDPVENEKGWNIKKLSEISVGKLSYGSGSSSITFDGNIRYIRITDIDDNGCLKDEIVSPSDFDSKYLLNDGDILFARSGATVGKTYWHRSSDGKCIYAGYLIRLIPKLEIVNPEYIFWFTKTHYYKSFIALSQKAVAQPNINAEQYGNLSICVPPLSLQQSFAQKIQSIESQKASINQSIAETQKLFDYTMDKYFG